ncbi:DUF2975 domain-containing protein [Gemmatimonadota bacterium]
MMTTGRFSLPIVLKTVLSVAWYLVLVLGVAFIINEAYFVISGKLTGEGIGIKIPVQLNEETYQIISPNTSDSGLVISSVQGTLEVRSPGFFLVFLNHLSNFLEVGITIMVVFLLRSVFRRVTAGDPFNPRNAGYLKLLGILLIVISVLESLIQFGLSSYITSTYETTGLTFMTEFPVNIPLLFTGLAIIVMGGIFQVGTDMRDDQALTI